MLDRGVRSLGCTEDAACLLGYISETNRLVEMMDTGSELLGRPNHKVRGGCWVPSPRAASGEPLGYQILFPQV